MASSTVEERKLLALYRSPAGGELSEAALHDLAQHSPVVATALRHEQADARAKNAPRLAAFIVEVKKHLAAVKAAIVFVADMVETLTSLGSSTTEVPEVAELLSLFRVSKSTSGTSNRGSGGHSALAGGDPNKSGWAPLAGLPRTYVAVNGYGAGGKDMASAPVVCVEPPVNANENGVVWWMTDGNLHNEHSALSIAASTPGRIRAPKGSGARATRAFVVAILAALGIEISADDSKNAALCHIGYQNLGDLGDPRTMDDAAAKAAFERRSLSAVTLTRF
jgi:hypothetical protein